MLSRKIPLKFIWGKLLNLSHEGLWVFVGQAGTAVVGLLGVKILTHVLNPAEYGLLALANTLMAFISMNLFGPLANAFMRYWTISKAKGELGKFYYISNQYGKYSIYIILGLAIVFGFAFGVLKNVDWAILLIILLIIGAVTGRFGLRLSIFTAMRRRQLVALLKVGSALFRPVLAAIIVLAMAPKAGYALIGYFLAALLAMAIAEYFYRKIIAFDLGSLERYKSMPLFQGLGRKILTFSWPFFAWTIFGWIHISCDRWVIQTHYGTHVVGTFAVVSLLAFYPITFGAGFLGSLFTPIAYQRAGDLSLSNNLIYANKILIYVTGIYIASAIIIVSIFAIFHYQLVMLISNINFVKLSYLLPGLTMAWALFHFGQMLTIFGMISNQLRSYILPKILSSIIAVTSTFYLSAKIGPKGIVWGLGAAGMVYAAWCFIITVKLVMHINTEKPFMRKEIHF